MIQDFATQLAAVFSLALSLWLYIPKKILVKKKLRR